MRWGVAAVTLRLGTDLVTIGRLRLALRRTPGIRQRLFTTAEQAYADSQSDPVPSLAARFAAKEAVMKALETGIGGLKFRDIEIQRTRAGAPQLRLHNSALARAQAAGVASWQVSLSHTDEVALAVVIGQP